MLSVFILNKEIKCIGCPHYSPLSWKSCPISIHSMTCFEIFFKTCNNKIILFIIGGNYIELSFQVILRRLKFLSNKVQNKSINK